MTERQESELYRRARRGDREAFVTLIDAHKDVLLGYLARLAGSRDRAEDLAQEAFLRLFEGRGRWRPELGSFRSYLFRIATNLLISQERRRQRWERLVPQLTPLNGHRQAPRQERDLERRELSARLARALREVPPQFRSALILHHLEGWSYEEIAGSLDCSIGTVKSRIHRARRALAERLAEEPQGVAP